MDSDDSNISDHVGDLDIQSYQFVKCIGQRSGQFQKVIINKMGVLGGYFQLRQCL
jgi:hypothetical protein